jgi:outer membrane protein assembly factor BamB
VERDHERPLEDRDPRRGQGAEGEAEAEQAQSRDGDRRERGRRGGRRGRRASKPTHVYEFRVLALDRGDGRVVWSRTVNESVPHEGIHPTGSFAAGSPLTDGNRIYAFFGSRGIYCLDMDGNVKWSKDLGDMRTRNGFGEGASPAVHGDTIVIPWDHEDDSFIAALDAGTGDERWRVARDEKTSWTTPVVVEVNGKPQVVMAGTNATVAYDLASGEEVWRLSGLTGNVTPTPVVGHGMIYLMSGFRGSALQAVRLEAAKGDITGTDAVVWTHGRGTPYVPSPVLSDRYLYFLRSNNGIISCYDAISGERYYDGERLERVENVYASPVAAGGHVYVCSRDGNIAVLKDGPELEVVATNSVGEGIDASPAIVGDAIYLRGANHLFRIEAADETN